MPEITSSDAQVLIYPQSAIPLKSAMGFVISDNLGKLLYPWSDNFDAQFEGINSFNPTAPVSWGAQPHFSSLNHIMSVRFLNNGQVAFGSARQATQAIGEEMPDASFLCRTPRVAWLDAQIGPNADTLSGSNDSGTPNTSLHFEALSGTWRTGLPQSATPRTVIANVGAEASASAKTVGDIPANRSLVFEVEFSGMGGKGLPAYALVIGQKWLLNFEHGKPPSIVQLFNLGLAHTFSEAPTMNLHGGHYLISFFRLFGRGIFSIGALNGPVQHFWFFDSQESLGNYSGSGGDSLPKGKEITWPAAPLFIGSYNVHAATSVAVTKYCDAAGTPFTADFTRTTKCYTDLGVDPTFITSYGGWAREGTSIAIVPALGTNSVDYTATLTCSADGIDTPGVQFVFVRVVPAMTSPSITPLDFRAACKKISVKLPLPSIADGSTCTLELDRVLLDKLVPGWTDTLKTLSPVVVRARHHYDDGTDSGWHELFEGQVVTPCKSTEEVNDQPLNLLCCDPVVTRLTNPAAMVTQRTPPLDYVLAEKFAAILAPVGGGVPSAAIYDGDCVQGIVRHFLGDGYADGMNGGQGANFYLPVNHPALYDNTSDTRGYLTIAQQFGEATTLPPVAGGVFRLPAPFKSDARSWIDTFEKAGRAKFAWLRLPGASGFCFFYGRMPELLAGRTPVVIPDRDYLSGDVNKLLSKVSSEQRPGAVINEIAVWGQSADGLEQFIPSLRMAEKRLPAFQPNGDPEPNSADKIGPRTRILVNGFALFSAEEIASQIIAQLIGVVHEWPQATMRGMGALLPGDVLEFKMSSATSDATIGLDGKQFRIEMLSHDLTFGTNLLWETSASCRPLTAGEKAAL